MMGRASRRVMDGGYCKRSLLAVASTLLAMASNPKIRHLQCVADHFTNSVLGSRFYRHFVSDP